MKELINNIIKSVTIVKNMIIRLGKQKATSNNVGIILSLHKQNKNTLLVINRHLKLLLATWTNLQKMKNRQLKFNKFIIFVNNK